MAKEIERKFLVAGDGWRRGGHSSMRLRQAYLASTDAAAIRVRIVDDRDAFLTIKSAGKGMSRDEFEYSIPVADAEAMLALRVGEMIEKIRHAIPCADGDLTVDEFGGGNEGLVIAEIELPDEACDPALPDWIGAEVTDDRRFYNASLSARPFSAWAPADRAAILGSGG
ncbi:CYTH domain-containing protein [Microbaculum marinum]|uniref:CYTH domain-containing protein n=1 Tax=Microbaculum marinum TaxID=1764581 RepID=A0AAW9RPQ7_9HYPH